LNRRVLGVVAAILLAAAGTWVLIQYVTNADERAIEGTQVVEVLVVDEAIPKGTPVLEAASRISTKLIPSAVRVPNALATLEPVRGLVTSVDLLPGEQVVLDRFVEAQSLLAQVRSIEVPTGLLELTIALTPERSVGGSLVPGDLVALLASFDPFTLDAVEPEDAEDLNSFLENDESVELLTLKTPNSTNITVYKALVTRVQIAAAPSEEDAQTAADVAPEGSLLISLAVDPGEAERIVFAAEFGAIWLAREQADSSEEPTAVITRANVYR